MKKKTKTASVHLPFYVVVVHRDPNKGDLKVPTPWPAFTGTGQQFLEINSKMDKNYVKQNMRLRYVHFWASILPSLAVNISE